MDLPAEELVDKVALYAAFTGITEPSSNDMFFLVVGRTGSGKSTFISQCTGKNANIGHSLRSCQFWHVLFYVSFQLTHSN